MDSFTIFMAMGFLFLMIFVIAYTIVTNRIIKDQDKEIAKLDNELRKAEAIIRKYSRRKEYKTATQIIEIHDNRIDEKNIPEFGNI